MRRSGGTAVGVLGLAVAFTACASGGGSGAGTGASTSSTAVGGPISSTTVPATLEAELRADPEVGDLIGWMLDHPQDVSVVVSSDGAPPEVSWNATLVRPVASTFKTIVLATYARSVADGRLDPHEVVAIEELERWLVPGTDGESHELMRQTYGTDAGVRLDDVAAAMMAFSTNTATDVLLRRLGREEVVDTMNLLGLPGLAAASAPPAGGVSLVADVRFGSDVASRLEALSSMDPAAVDRAAWQSASDFGADPSAGAQRAVEALGAITTLEGQLALTQALPWRARPIDLHDLLVSTVVEGRLGSVATEIVRRHMSWPLLDPAVAAQFDEMAAKEGELPGTVAATAVGKASSGPMAGVARTVVVTVHGMDLDTWSTVRGDAQEYQALALRLLVDPAFVSALAEVLSA